MNELSKSSNLLKTGGVLAILLGVTRLLAGLGYVLLPPELRLFSAGPNFLPAFNQNPDLLLAVFWVETAAGILGIGVIPALASFVKNENEGLVRWVSNLAILGFGFSAAGYLLSIVRIPVIASAFVAGDASTKAALAVVWRSSIDLMGFWGYGTVGVWILVLCWLSMKNKIFPSVLSILGILAGILYILIPIGVELKAQTVILLVSVIGAVVGPIWYIWVGIVTRQKTS
jgi:hypothetical protein